MPRQKLEDEAKFKIDIINTILGNILWILLLVFVIIFIGIGFKSLEAIEDDYNKILALIVILFTTVKLITWIGHPQTSWIERKYLQKD